MSENDYWQAVLQRDKGRDSAFVYAVRSTGIYCRPSCPSRRPGREQVSFYQEPEAAEREGFRAGRRCRPQEAAGAARVVEQVCRYIEEHLDQPLDLETLGL